MKRISSKGQFFAPTAPLPSLRGFETRNRSTERKETGEVKPAGISLRRFFG